MKQKMCRCPVAGWGVCSALVFALVLHAAPAWAEPYTPASEQEVLEVLPVQLRQDSGEIAALRKRWQANTQDENNAAALARLYMETGRSQSDPRYYGYAEAVLQAWWSKPEPPVEIQLLRATLRQHQHEYAGAMDDLRQVLKRAPNTSQAWLTLAVIQMVRGEYAEARQSCSALAVHASTWLASLCHAQLMGLTGNARRAYQLQTALFMQMDAQEVELRQWAATLMGETAWRLGKTAEADEHFRDALKEPRQDNYLLRVYSDYLISQRRPGEVMDLLKDKSGDDALLLRLTIASRDAGRVEAEKNYRQMLEDRYEAARLRGSSLHARDEALYLLEFGGDPARALRLAENNWALQKESDDTLLLLRAAVANHQPEAAAPVVQWLHANKQEDVRLGPWLKQLESGGTS